MFCTTLQDIEKRHKTEVDYFAGTIIKLGKKYSVNVPINKFLYKCIKILEEKNDNKINGL